VGRRKWAGGGVGGLEEKVGRRERKKKERGRRAAGLGREEREREGLGSFFKNLFKLTFQTFEIELFSKHSKIFNIFKSF
jgi:hypothetical protein